MTITVVTCDRCNPGGLVNGNQGRGAYHGRRSIAKTCGWKLDLFSTKVVDMCPECVDEFDTATKGDR